MCALPGNMIYVAIQYRLGIFGFLGGSSIAQDGVLNAGLLDQRAALDWVQRNIRQFGTFTLNHHIDACADFDRWRSGKGDHMGWECWRRQCDCAAHRGRRIRRASLLSSDRGIPYARADAFCKITCSADRRTAWWQPFLNQSEQDIGYFNALRLSNCSTVQCLRSLSVDKLAYLNQAVLNSTYPGPGSAFGVSLNFS